MKPAVEDRGVHGGDSSRGEGGDRRDVRLPDLVAVAHGRGRLPFPGRENGIVVRWADRGRFGVFESRQPGQVGSGHSEVQVTVDAQGQGDPFA